MLRAGDAAQYVALPLKCFRSLCPVTPVEMPNGEKLWDIQDLDRWIDSLKAGGDADADELIARLE